MAKFKGAVLEKLKSPLKLLDDIEVPELKRGQVLVQMAYSGVCHSQLMEADGQRGEDKFLPHFLGHEATGFVRAIGVDVAKVTVGDRVILGWIKGQGIEAGGCVYSSSIGKINSGGVTTFSEYAVASENRLVKLPESIPMDEGVLFGCAIPTGAGIVLNEVQPKPGTSIAIWGLGGIGMSALMACQAFDCKNVIAIDISQEKLALAREFGATHTIDASRASAASESVSVESLVLGIVGPQGLDYCVEAAGRVDTIERAFGLVKRGGGLCVFASHPSFGEKIKIDPFEMICGKQIKGSWGGGSQPDRDILVFEKLYRAGKLPLKKLLTKSYSLDQINNAMDDLRQHKVGRPLIRINPDLKC